MDFSAMSILSAIVEVAIIGAIEIFFARKLPGTRTARIVAIMGLGLFLVLIFFVDLSTFPKPQLLASNGFAFDGKFSLAEVETIQLGAAMVAVLLGWAAHWFKQLDQLWFGNFEVLFGVATAFQSARAFGQDSSAIEIWIALGASAYIVARGLGNRRDAVNAGALASQAKPEVLAAAT